MLAFLAHVGLEPLIYGIIIALGLLVVLAKVMTGRFLSVAIDCFVFWLVFAMHGGSMTGGMAAAVAALLCGLTIPFMLRRMLR